MTFIQLLVMFVVFQICGLYILQRFILLLTELLIFIGPNSKVSMVWYFCAELENSGGVARETPQTVILFSDKRVTSTGTFNLSGHQSQFHCNYIFVSGLLVWWNPIFLELLT